MHFSEICWDTWRPRERATLLFIRIGNRLLLIHKKKGLGAGKLNGPGGRIEPGESPAEAAVREVEEELGITPTGVEPAGELQFQFVDGFSIHGYVFRAEGYSGEPRETEEAIPCWVAIDAIPYHRMWADDRVWLPLMLDHKPFVGRFLFEGEQMLGCDIVLGPNR